MKVYIAAPLFNEIELERNVRVRDHVRSLGFETYLPQQDGGISYDLITSGGAVAETRKKIFENDIQQITESDIVLCLLDGRVPDEGMCIELGMGYALQKACIGYLTDQRGLDAYGPSLMIEGCLSRTCRSMQELSDELLLLQKTTG